MNTNLLIFYGELRSLPVLLPKYNLDKWDTIVATWNSWERLDNRYHHNKVFNPNEYDNLKMVVTPDKVYGKLISHQNCIIWHCWKVLNSIDINQYDNIILQRTDMHVNLNKIDLSLVEDDVVYRLFGNSTEGQGDGNFMNDIVVVGKANTIKEYYDSEKTILPSDEEIEHGEDKLPLMSGFETKPVTESVWGGKIKDIQKHLTPFEDYKFYPWQRWINFYREKVFYERQGLDYEEEIRKYDE